MDLTKVDIITKRLQLVTKLHDYHEFDKEIFNEMNSDITTYMTWDPFHTLEDTKVAVEKRYQKILAGECVSVRVLDKNTNEFLGHGTLTEVNTRTPELGIWIKKAAHGKHYGKETMEGLKKWAEENLDYDYLIYPVDKRNIASIKIAESLGGVIEKTYDEEIGTSKILHTVEYRIYKKA